MKVEKEKKRERYLVARSERKGHDFSEKEREYVIIWLVVSLYHLCHTAHCHSFKLPSLATPAAVALSLLICCTHVVRLICRHSGYILRCPVSCRLSLKISQLSVRCRPALAKPPRRPTPMSLRLLEATRRFSADCDILPHRALHGSSPCRHRLIDVLNEFPADTSRSLLCSPPFCHRSLTYR